VLQDIEANTTFLVNIAVIDLGGELDLRGGEGVVHGELDRKEEYTTLIRRILRTDDGSSPFCEITARRAGGDVFERLQGKIRRKYKTIDHANIYSTNESTTSDQ
jgi:hypothetical protein